ncbi:MAG: HAMP domain-containing histidine kinase, partial [Clostridia bacterium]|nr:HAMP domain-containing histidine kinase [Clostridia bacterium]
MWLTVLVSLVIGSTAAFLTTKYSMDPVGRLVTHINRLASGDYRTRLSDKDFLAGTPAFQSVTESFNKLAEELQNTEMLRSDFINNFSHEFKTPIVSIAGFTKLLKRGNLTEEQQREYLDIIEEESLRLSAMATNVLNMTKIENQTILTDTTTFNVSEQIRSAILLLDEKWDRKHIELSADFNEYTITGNE